MAFIVNETEIQQFGGNKGLSILFADFTNTAGSTGGTISPGYSTGGGIALADSKQIRRIKRVIVETSTAAGNEPQVVTSFDMGKQADVSALTTAANQSGKLMIIGESWGA